MYNLLDTFNVSYILCTVKVKNLLNMNKSQVTKASNSWVGTSEAIRMLNFNHNKKLELLKKKLYYI